MFDWLFNWFFELLYILQKSICYLIDFICEIFYKLAGIETVNIAGRQTDLLSYFVQSDKVKIAFLGVMLVGIILLAIFTMIAILKSETAEAQHKKTKGQILGKSSKSFIIFLLIPFMVIAGIYLINAIMGAINTSMTASIGTGRISFGGQILATSGSSAFKGKAGTQASIEQMFLDGRLDYNNMDTVKKYYDLSGINYFVGIVSGLILVITFALAVIKFVQRIFDVILLYIISPISASTIPLDDGQRFKIWREMLVSKILGAYGIILCMNLFFLIVPTLTSIRFFNDSFKNGVVSLLFIIGGAFAVTKANLVVSQLTGENAGTQETQQMLGNINSGIRMMKNAGRFAIATAGTVLGGTDFRKNQKKGVGFIDNVSSNVHGTRNQHQVDNPKDTQKKDNAAKGSDLGQSKKHSDDAMWKQRYSEGDNQVETNDAEANKQPEKHDKREMARKVGKTATGAMRLATLPVGVLKDLVQGGVITAGKNIVPRFKNVIQGKGVYNRADVMKKPTVRTMAETSSSNTTEQSIKENTMPEKNNVINEPQTATPFKDMNSILESIKNAANTEKDKEV